MAPKRSELEGKKKEAQPPTGEWTYSKCFLHDLKRLVSEGLLQEKNLVNWRPSLREPSRMCAEELSDKAALLRVQRVLLDVDAVPYVPELFSVRNPPKPVSIRLLFVEDELCSTAAN
jgi:hypothetical protein